MESSHSNHGVAVVLNNKDVRTGIKPDTSSVIKQESELSTVDRSAVYELPIGGFTVPCFHSFTMSRHVASRLLEHNLPYADCLFISLFYDLPRSINAHATV